MNGIRIDGPDGMLVAEAADFNRVDRDAEVEANADLIAAATELRDLLTQYVNGANCPDDGPTPIAFEKHACQRARALLKSLGVKL